MAKSTKRASQVASAIRPVIAQVLQHEVHDPRLAHVTVASVDVSPDLKNAKVYFFLHDVSQLKEVQSAFTKASAFLRCRLAESIVFRHVPQLHFVYDASLDRGDAISKLLDHVMPPSPV